MHIINFLRLYSSVTLIHLLIATFPSVNGDEECETDINCQDSIYGDHSECDNGFCRCNDYYVLGAEECVMMVPYGRPCTEKAQCEGSLGNMATCSAVNGTRICICYAITGEPVELYKGSCYLTKNISQPCATDEECLAGSTNEFVRCIENTCQCYSNGTIHFVADGNGNCTLEYEECGTRVSFSVFAVSIAISVVLLLLIIFIYRVTNPNKSSTCVANLDKNRNANSTNNTCLSPLPSKLEDVEFQSKVPSTSPSTRQPV